MAKPHRVVIIGGGFGGLRVARSLRRAPVQVTLIDKRNFHLFQPLLYQVATGGLSPANIASPLRNILKRNKNVQVLLAEAREFDPKERRIELSDGAIEYDTLIVAAGAGNHYFGHDLWAASAPGLKSIEDATEIRRRALLAFERAERESEPEVIRQCLTFVIIGGGPTGVELAGALAEIARDTLRGNFRSINPASANIILLEAAPRILGAFPERLSARAAADLSGLGVLVKTGAMVTEVTENSVSIRMGEKEEVISTRTVLWAAGVHASPLGKILASKTNCETDGAGRIIVEPDCTIPNYPEIIVIGDLAGFNHQGGGPLPGVAPVAIQQGRYAARLISNRLKGRATAPFRYRNLGNMATIGRARAVADFGLFHLTGYPAWLAWLFVHLMQLVEFQNRILAFVQWAWNYFTYNRGARLITGENPLPLVQKPEESAPDEPDSD